jgi:hypothetical protein
MKQIESAKKYLIIADHLLTTTYPALKETKLFLSVIQNIFLAFSNMLEAFLLDQFNKKNIGMFGISFDDRFKIYQKLEKKYGLNHEYSLIMIEIKKVLLAHKSSSVEFGRNNKYIICNDSYEMDQLTEERAKGFLGKAKLFIRDIDAIIVQDG